MLMIWRKNFTLLVPVVKANKVKAI